MHCLSSVLLLVFSFRTIGVLGYVDPSYSDADVDALADLIDQIDNYAFTTALTNGSTTKTAQGYILLNSTTPTFTDIDIRATISATEIVYIPEMELEFTQFINPISTSATPARRQKRAAALRRDQIPMDVCPVPKTVTVIEWVDCAATPSLSCDVCPTVTTTSCEGGIRYIAATPTSTCTTTQRSCSTCPGGVEYIIIGTPTDNNYSKRPCPTCSHGYEYVYMAATPTVECTTTKRVCPTCPGGYEFIILGTPTGDNYSKRPCPTCSGGFEYVIINDIDINVSLGNNNSTQTMEYQSHYAYLLTLIISSKSKLVVSTEAALLADWSSQLTFPSEPTATTMDDDNDDDEDEEDVTTPTQIHDMVVPTPDGGEGLNDLTNNTYFNETDAGYSNYTTSSVE